MANHFTTRTTRQALSELRPWSIRRNTGRSTPGIGGGWTIFLCCLLSQGIADDAPPAQAPPAPITISSLQSERTIPKIRQEPRDTLIKIQYAENWRVVIHGVIDDRLFPVPYFACPCESTLLFCGPPGSYAVVAVGPGPDNFLLEYITILGTGPPPPPPPTEVPFPAPGLTVIILFESQDLDPGTFPPEQRAIFRNSQVIRWMQDHCHKLPGNDYAYRAWDDDYTEAVLSQVQPTYIADAYRIIRADANGRVPWLGISDGKHPGYLGELPKNVNAMLALLKNVETTLSLAP